MKYKQNENDLQCELYYVADSAANGRQLLWGEKTGLQHNHPIKIHRDLGGLKGLALQVFELQKNHLKGIHSPYFGFSFDPPYQIAMWDQRVWFTERLSDREQVDFLKEMQKNYSVA
ncbi:MAG: hypothetical protein A2Y10_05960 [Planctomycetes bacterium GWF2_41_51]|nr:MAG: hypothetical protein A2Y10_05960 [Planctomycetes bacterium GWF2_41_51]